MEELALSLVFGHYCRMGRVPLRALRLPLVWTDQKQQWYLNLPLRLITRRVRAVSVLTPLAR